jgi:GAF domain-containing protein
MSGAGTDTPALPVVDFDLIERQVAALLEDENDFIANAANFAALVFDALPLVNWAGFYFPDPAGLVLGPFGGKPACTRLPKGRGVCGKAFETFKSVIVDDVSAFGDHIVCDTASRSELVVPLLHDGAAYGVFDIDSPVLARFQDSDRAGVERLVRQFVFHTPLPQQYRTEPAESSVRINQRIDVQTCRDHHSVLRYLVEELGKHDKSAEESLALLGRFRSVLVTHLRLEDDYLYPRLGQSANAIIRGKAERYKREMGGVREQFVQLWQKWSAPNAIAGNIDGWQNDWRKFSQTLTGRIDTEDSDLYIAAEADMR